MYPPGHIAINLMLFTTLNRTFQKIDRQEWRLPFWPAFLAALAPDVVDKVVCDYLHLMPYGRNWMHNLTAVVLCSLAVGGVMRSRHVGLAWAVGHLGHLLGDFVFIPWLWPLFEYSWPNDNRQIAQGVVQTIVDLGRGHTLSTAAAAIWDGGRLWFESFFFLTAALAWRKCLRNMPYKTFFYFSCILWLSIIMLWEWKPFLWSWTHYGIR